MSNLNPLKYCFFGKHSRPRATFRTVPGVENTRPICADCYDKLRASREQGRSGDSAQPKPVRPASRIHR